MSKWVKIKEAKRGFLITELCVHVYGHHAYPMYFTTCMYMYMYQLGRALSDSVCLFVCGIPLHMYGRVVEPVWEIQCLPCVGHLISH